MSRRKKREKKNKLFKERGEFQLKLAGTLLLIWGCSIPLIGMPDVPYWWLSWVFVGIIALSGLRLIGLANRNRYKRWGYHDDAEF